jgi:broad specificity phosphatase PhoE
VDEVLIVRHAMPVVEANVPAELWRLSDEGRATARDLAAAFPQDLYAVTSDEPKARQTAEEALAVCGGTLTVDARVGETRRPHRWDENFADSARQFVAGRPHTGWEPQVAIVRRFDAAVRDSLRASDGVPVAVFNHGQALTLWLHSIGAVENAPSFWSGLTFPDAWLVSVEASSGHLVAARGPVRVR